MFATARRAMSDQDDRNETYYRSLKRNMILVMILVSVTPLLVIAGTILYYFDVSYSQRVEDHLRTLVKKHAQNINTFLDANLASIQFVASSFPYEKLADKKFLSRLLATLREEHGRSFVDLGLVDENGLQVAYAGPFHLEGANYAKAEWFKEAIGQHWYISDVFQGLRDLPHFIVAVRGEKDGRRWILRATVDFDAFNRIVKNIRIGATGFAFIINRKGELQTDSRFVTALPTDMYLNFLKTGGKGPLDVTVRRLRNASQDEILSFMAPLKNGDWLLGYQQKAADAYSVLYNARRIALGIFAVGCLGIILAAVYLSNRMIKRISLSDAQNAMMNEQVIEAGKLASVGELAAGIAHEINNPVAIMVEEAGWIEDLLEEEDLKACDNLEEFRRALWQIRTQGKRCKEITHKLLSFARKTDPIPARLQLNELVEEVVALCDTRARYDSVSLVTNLDPQLPPVEVAPSEIQQVLLNLINNSLDAMDSKGGKLEITTRTEDAFAVIDVADEGPGIPMANLQRIFDPFFTTKPVGQGTGLGLSICYGIVKKLGGDISVNSAMGIGTTFHIKIPMQEGQARVHYKYRAGALGSVTGHENASR
jgi:two-component system NtrC family sensor kinase